MILEDSAGDGLATCVGRKDLGFVFGSGQSDVIA
jgi:hypothetical protein